MRLIELDVLFTVSHRPDFDSIELARVLKDARMRKGMTIRSIADALSVPVTEAEHWFRTDRYNAPPEVSIWPRVRDLLDIEGWDAVGVSIPVPNVFEMGGRAYHEKGLSPTITANHPGWIAVEV